LQAFLDSQNLFLQSGKSNIYSREIVLKNALKNVHLHPRCEALNKKFMVFKKPGNSRDDKSSKSSGRPAKGDGPKRPATSSSRGKSGAARSNRTDSGRPAKRFSSDSSENKSYSRKPSGTGYGPGDKPARKFGSSTSGDKKPYGDKRSFGGNRDSKPAYGDRPKRGYSNDAPEKKSGKPTSGSGYRKREGDNELPFRKRPESSYANRPAREKREDEAPKRVMRSRNKKTEQPADDGLIRLNRYISNAGICSRRKADELIVAGVVSVNGEVVSLKLIPLKM